MSKQYLGSANKVLGVLLGSALLSSAIARDIIVPDEFESIQEAIDAANSGDIIIVEQGRYEENIQVKSNIELIGREAARTLLVPAESGDIVTIDTHSDFKLRNFTLIDGGSGIVISRSTNIEISNTIFDLGENGIGVTVTDDSSVNLINNTLVSNDIDLNEQADMITIENNLFSEGTVLTNSSAVIDNISFNCFSNVNDVIGSDTVDGEVLFVDIVVGDFHLKENSVCRDSGKGLDIDETSADAGAYGGLYVDKVPFPVAGLSLSDVTVDDTAPFNLQARWQPNESYLVGGYKLYYDFDQSGPPYEGAGAEDEFGEIISSPIRVEDAVSFTLYNIPIPDVTPNAPELESVIPENERLTISWSSVENANAYRIEYGIASLDENQIDVGNITEYTLEDLENGSVYNLAVSAINRANVYVSVVAVESVNHIYESDFSDEEMIVLGPQQISARSNELIGVPSLVEAYPNLPDQEDSRCFIATAAYGHYSVEQVRLLRQFRDQYLLTNSAGRNFVGWYYKHSPEAATYIEGKEAIKFVVRILLLPFIMLAWFMTELSLLAKIAAIALIGFVVILRFRNPYYLKQNN